MKAAASKQIRLPELLYRMLRPRVAVSLLLFSLVGIAATGIEPKPNIKLLLAFLLLCFWYINATSINDLSDYKIDLINLKGSAERPLIGKRIARKDLSRLYSATLIFALILALLLDWKIAVITGISLVLNYIYSMPPIRISYRGFIAVLMLPLGYILFPFLAGAWSQKGVFSSSSVWLLVALYISFMGRIVLKDFRDVVGDAKFGKLTFLLRYGKQRTCILSAFTMSIGTLIISLTVNDLVFGLALIVYLLMALWSLYLLSKVEERDMEIAAIAGVVRSASGAVISLLIVLTTRLQQKPLANQRLTYLVLIVLFGFWVLDTIKPVYTKVLK